MTGTFADLQLRMERFSDAALNAIICAPPHLYTGKAREAAAVVLRRRAVHESGGVDDAAPPDMSHRHPSVGGEAPPAPVRFVPWLRAAFSRWQERTLPAGIPLRIRDLFWLGIVSAFPAILAIAAAFWSGTDIEAAVQRLTSYSSLAMLATGALGLIVSYGILKELNYPRVLAIPFVAAASLSSLRPLRREDDDSIVEPLAGLTWSYETVSYLLSSSEAVAYYAQLRGRCSRASHHNQEEAPLTVHGAG